jgi:hypothetical protein
MLARLALNVPISLWYETELASNVIHAVQQLDVHKTVLMILILKLTGLLLNYGLKTIVE